MKRSDGRLGRTPARALILLAAVLLGAAVPGCGGGGGGGGSVSTTSGISVSVTPLASKASIGGSQAFAATVTGTANTAVTWSVQEGNAGGAITQAGVYTAPNTPGTYHVVATSQADNSQSATVAIVVQAGSASGTIQ
ncbi:MAG TPA: hypothetical protein VKU00_23990 [Chthonomonadaceae bacterium]|nr:hypothetical protein [Chthonomonadaceae bacterium]